MKYRISLIFFLSLIVQLQAQNDTLSVFRSPVKNNANSKAGTYKNALNFNLFQIIRGGALLSYERALASSGLAITAGVGINKFDAIGQVYFRELSYYYKLDLDVEKEGTKIKPLIDVGLKYYTNQTMGGTYFEVAFTMIKNTVNLQAFNYNEYYSIPAGINHLDYRSNELKLLVGFTNSNDKEFYHDFNFGIGYRFIQFEKFNVKQTYNNGNSTFSYELTKEMATNQTPWFFFTWKMGRRF